MAFKLAMESILTPVMTLEGHEERIPSISYFPGGKQIISGSWDNTARRWDLQAGKEIDEARDACEQEVRAVAVSRDGRWVVTAGGDYNTDHGELRVCEVETGIAKIFQGHSKRITCIDISADSTLLASGSWDETAQISSLDTGKLVAGPFRSVHYVSALRFSQDSKKLAVVSDMAKRLEVWDVQAQKLDVSLAGKRIIGSGAYTSVFWTTKDKSIVAAFSFTDDTPWTIYEFNVSTLHAVGVPFRGHTMVVTGLALSFDCALLASTSSDQTIKLWAFESRQLLASFDVRRTDHIIFSPDSRQLVYTTWCDNKIRICDTPPDILASIWPAQEAQPNISAPQNQRLAFLVNSGAKTRPAALRRKSIILPDISFPPPTRRPSLTIVPQLPALPPVRNNGADYPLSEAILQDLSKYITKDEDYPVARGGFGEIWKCTYHLDRKPIKVAVKALQVYAADQLGPEKKKKIKRIQRELRICASLKHANILPVYGYTSGFGPFLALVSPWAENGNLTTYLERDGATLTLVRQFQILRDIIAGLQYLHANNVIHGDFNGPNVLIHGDGTACIADFGLSLMFSEVISASQASWTSTLKGNLRWMAPELLRPREDGILARPSEQSDIYSFGGIMLQVLTNKIPYCHLSKDAAIILCIARLKKPSRSLYPPLLDKYWHFIEQCWSADPQERPSTERVDEMIRNEFYSLSRSR